MFSSLIQEYDEKSAYELQAQEIQNEYRKIDRAWLKLHYRLSLVLVLFAWMVESALSVVIVHSELLTTTLDRFIWKFMLVPTGLNLCLLGISTLAIRSRRLRQQTKIYIVSLSFVGICAVLFTVHNIFVATYYIFTVAIMLTSIYANYQLTCFTAISSLACMVFSELFIQWDLDKVSIFDSTARFAEFMIAIAILIAFAFICMVVIRYERMKNKASIEMTLERRVLQRKLQVDEMTGVFNRKALNNALKDVESDLSGDRYILAIADIDNFKNINDKWGHHIGDLCLLAFSEKLKSLGNRGISFRYGGDEFCLLFRGLDLQEVIEICESIKHATETIQIQEEPLLELSASFGISVFSKHMDAAEFFIHADRALYEAKEERNKVCVFRKKTNARSVVRA